jgi:insulin-like growth factor-binding protein complex acid labile subunit
MRILTLSLFFSGAFVFNNQFSMERPPAPYTIREEATASHPASPLTQERESYPISPSPSEASVSATSGKRKQSIPARAFKRTRANESFSITYYLQNNPNLIKSRINGNTLDLSGLSLSSLDGLLAVPGIKSIVNMSLSHNMITHIERKDFAGLSQLVTLDLSNNDIAFLETDGFAELPQLTNLFLNNNRIFGIEHESFAHLDHLKKLSLSHNRLTVISPKLFAGIPNLEELDLTDNSIADIERHTFSDVSFLKKLKLNKNQLTKLTGPMFEGTKYKREQIGGRDRLSALLELDLRDNKLTEIPTVILVHLPNLQRLLLSNNHIAQITPQNIAALKKATSVKYIDLVNNKLTDTVLKKLKDALPQVTVIATVAMETTETVGNLITQFSAAEGLSDIAHTLEEAHEEQVSTAAHAISQLQHTIKSYENSYRKYIKTISEKDTPFSPISFWYDFKNLGLNSLEGLLEFPDMHDMTIIDLSYNALTSIQANSFAGLNKLQGIDLANNKISFIDPLAFANVPNLNHLYLNSNSLTQLTPDVFKDLKNLEILVLDNNQIEQFPVGIFKGLSNLSSLSLANNKISSITIQDLAALENLKHLTLHGNQIKNLDPEILIPFKHLRYLDIRSNPLTQQNIDALKKALPRVKIIF